MPRPGKRTRGDERGRGETSSVEAPCPGRGLHIPFDLELAVYVVFILFLGLCLPRIAKAQDLHSYVAPDGRTFDQLVAAHVMPDPDTTPGVLNPAVTQETLSTTVCSKVKDKHGFTWVHDQRPPDSYTDRLKLLSLPPGMKPEDCEYDHLDSIEDGGSPTDPRNLWCMVYNDLYGARVKDVLETHVARALCAGKMTLDEARAALAPNWMLGYVKYIGPLPKPKAPEESN